MLVVGICGGSGSGKTALAEALEHSASAPACIVSQDSYYHDRSGWTEERSRALSFDEPRSLDLDRLSDDVVTLAAGKAIEVPCYCFETHRRLPATRRQEATDIVVVEGTLIFSHQGLRETLDHRVFLDVPADIRFIRRLQRDVRERGRSVESVVSQYLETVKPMHDRHVAPQAVHAHRVLNAHAVPIPRLVEACWKDLGRDSTG